ncbi:MAG TPA: hypothetical protein VHZ55_18875 [Bryobacteraceae bacterium]|jgi:flagellar protein FlgJ|nr:hypothetical protein [Bryobacteraceae bacterium]
MSVSLGNATTLNLAYGSDISPTADKATKIHKAAQQFESLMVGEMLKSVREDSSDGWMGGGESTGDDSAMSMAESQLANALSQNGGLGLSSVIERSLTKESNQKVAETLPASSPNSSVNMQ